MARKKTDNTGRQAMAARLRAKTRDGEETEDYMLALVRGEVVSEYKQGIDGRPYPAKLASPAERAYAANWLDERMFGKLTEEIDAFGELTEAQEDALYAALQERIAKRKAATN